MNNSNSSISNVTQLRRIVTGFYIFTGTLSLIGNSIVIAVTLKKSKNRKSIFKLLLAHLAVCDLLFAIFLLVDIPTWISAYWIYHDVLCKIIPSLQLTASLVAEGTVVVIAIERYNGISNPLKLKWSRKDLIVALLLAWIFSVASVSPYFAVLTTIKTPKNNESYCVEVWNENKDEAEKSSFIYTTYLFLGSFIIPMILLAVLYGRIIFIIRKPLQPIKSCYVEMFRKRREKDIRVTKLLITVVVAFAICVLPNHIGHLILSKGQLGESVQHIIRYLMLIPYPFQCMINPVIYSIVDKIFRRDVKNLFLCRHDKIINHGTTMNYTTCREVGKIKHNGYNGRVSTTSTKTVEEEDLV